MDRPRLAKDIMVTKLVTLTPRMNVFDGIARLLKHELTGAPVIDRQGAYTGVFSEKCCMSLLTTTAQLLPLQDLKGRQIPRAGRLMTTKLVTLSPDMDVFDAIGLLLTHGVSGAPVIDETRQFLGVFSEKASMQVLLDAAYDQLPTSQVDAFMDVDRGRVVDEEKPLLSIAQTFLDTPYRRLVVLREGALIGQISRREVLRAAHTVCHYIPSRIEALGGWSAATSPASQLETIALAAFMDRSARTIGEDLDLLSIAQVFRQTPYRRLPVLRGTELVGQISRRDLLKATYETMSVPRKRELALLYLSSLTDRADVEL